MNRRNVQLLDRKAGWRCLLIGFAVCGMLIFRSEQADIGSDLTGTTTPEFLLIDRNEGGAS